MFLLRLIVERQLVLVPLEILDAHFQLLVDFHPRIVHLAQGGILFGEVLYLLYMIIDDVLVVLQARLELLVALQERFPQFRRELQISRVTEEQYIRGVSVLLISSSRLVSSSSVPVMIESVSG